MSEDLPKQELLIKLLKMTTSSNDGEAVVAVRKANALLVSAGWDWEKLIHGKIKVIEDPFKNITDPGLARNVNINRAPPPPPPQPRPAPPPRPAPSAGIFATAPNPSRQPPPPPPPAQPLGAKANIYAGWCYCCGDAVIAKAGFIFDPHSKNRNAKSKWQIVCIACNTNRYANIGPTAAPRQRPLGNATPDLSQI